VVSQPERDAQLYGADGQLRGSDGSTCFSRFDLFYPSTPFCEGPATLSNSTAGAFEWYRYDGLGRRVLVRTRRDHSCTNGQACTSELTRYLWDGDQLLAEIRVPGGNVSAQVLENDRPVGTEHGSVLYTHGPALDRPLDIIRMGLYASAWGDAYPVHPIADFRGGFVDGADADGKRLPCGNGPCVIVWPRFSAFYTQRATQTNFFGSLVTGKEDASGFTYMRNRYYNPHTGAFTQSDPIGLAGGLNAYGFAAGDPVSYSDPYGLCPDPENPKCTEEGGTLTLAAGVGLALLKGFSVEVGIAVNRNGNAMLFGRLGKVSGYGESVGWHASIQEGSLNDVIAPHSETNTLTVMGSTPRGSLSIDITDMDTPQERVTGAGVGTRGDGALFIVANKGGRGTVPVNVLNVRQRMARWIVEKIRGEND
jgi:RHS repeat-associated protein